MKNEWEDNMDELEALSQNLGEIKFTKRVHPGLVADAKTTILEGINGDPWKLYDWMIKEFGHCVMGKWQFLYEKNDKRISCIRSGVSFGAYEIYGMDMEDPERFKTAEATLNKIKDLLK